MRLVSKIEIPSPKKIVIFAKYLEYMRKFLLVLVLCGCASCSLFDSKEKKTQKLVEKELQQIDWSNVDDYPLFDDCDETVSKELQKNCFETQFLEHLSSGLEAFQMISESEVKEVIYLDFKIKNDGSIIILNIENKQVLGSQTQSFEAKIIESLKNMPQIAPALKRGIPVNTKFRIPIFLNSN